MEEIRYSKADIERIITDLLVKQGYENFQIFSHTAGVTVYIKQEEDEKWQVEYLVLLHY